MPLAMGSNTTSSLINPATGGTLLTAAEEIWLNDKLGTYQVLITDQDDRLIAQFQWTAYR